jgi:ribosomal protein S18 acetylase RimI-like enzyme
VVPRVAEIQIRPLERLSLPDLKRLSTGYTSPQAYRVTKDETPERTTIALELVYLETPFVKQFDNSDGLSSYYRSAVKKGLSLGAYDGDTMIGIAIADRQDWNRTLLLWEFHVAASHRRLGLGRRLMDALAERARDAGMRVITVETSNMNVPAIAFYRRVGFAIEAIDLTFYSNDDLERGEVAVFMKRKLEQ